MKYRIFIGLQEIAGYYHNLKKGFEAINIPTMQVDITRNQFAYGTEEGEVRPKGRLYTLRDNATNPFLRRTLTRLIGMLQQLRKIPLFFYSLFKFNVFIFGFHSTFLRYWELPLLKLLGKKIIYVYHGCDSRPPYLSGYAMAPSRGFSVRDCVKATRDLKRRIGRVERYADLIINHPSQAHLHERRFVQTLCLGLPYSMDHARTHENGINRSAEGTRGCRVLHAPSFSEAKGSIPIGATVGELQSEGISIDYIKIMGRPNYEVLREIEQCDFVIDQLYSDTPMAGFATEAAFLGKPAVVGGYYSSQIEKDIPKKFIPPSLYCHPDRIKDAIRKLATDEVFRRELGAKARQFVEENWSAEKVASRYLQLLDGEIPDDWWFHPGNIGYLHGCGFQEEKVKLCLRDLMEYGGRAALQLSDKPELEQSLVAFASDT